MPVYSNDVTLTFNGPSSVADQFSTPANLTIPTYTRDCAFFFKTVCTAAGVLGVTLQYNPDPFAQTYFGWQDYATSSINIYCTETLTTLSQTNAAISSGALRAGIISATGTYNCLLKFTPMPYYYRLRFQLDSSFVGTIPKISFSSGS